MKDSFFIKTIQVLDEEEVKRFALFLKSPFFNKNERFLRFYEEVLKYYPAFNHKHFSKEKIFSRIFPKEPFSDQKFRVLVSDTFKVLKQYLIFCQINEHDKNMFRLRFYHERNLNDFYTKEWQKISRSTTTQKDSIQSRYKQKTLEELHFENALRSNSRKGSSNIKKLIHSIDIEFLFKRLKYVAETLNRSNIIPEDKPYLHINEILSLSEKEVFANIIPIQIYYTLIQMLLKDESKYYLKAKQIITKHITSFTKDEAHDQFIFLQNFCIKRINLGEESFLEELFDLYRISLSNELIIENGKIPLSVFKNIATVGIRLSKINWVKEFTNSYTSMLEKKHQESAYGYNMARVFFYEENYKQSIKSLTSIRFTDVYFELGCRLLLIKIYYELNDFEAIESHIKTLVSFVKRNKSISPYHKEIHKNFALVTKKLFEAKEGNIKQIDSIEKLLEEKKEIADLTWVLNTLEEIKNPSSKKN